MLTISTHCSEEKPPEHIAIVYLPIPKSAGIHSRWLVLRCRTSNVVKLFTPSTVASAMEFLRDYASNDEEGQLASWNIRVDDAQRSNNTY